MSSYHDAIRSWWKSSAESRSTASSCRKIRDHKKHHACVGRTILFPNFGYCKTNKQFPISFTSCVNSGDIGSLRALLESRTTRNCSVNMLGQELEISDFLRVMELCEELYPDCTSSVPQVRSMGTHICAVLYVQYTASKIIDRGIKEHTRHEGDSFNSLFRVCQTLHTDPHRLNDFINSHPAEDRPSLLARVYSAEELLVRSQGVMRLTISEKTGKIRRIEINLDSVEYEVVDNKEFRNRNV